MVLRNMCESSSALAVLVVGVVDCGDVAAFVPGWQLEICVRKIVVFKFHLISKKKRYTARVAHALIVEWDVQDRVSFHGMCSLIAPTTGRVE